jgi:hypothetical protein
MLAHMALKQQTKDLPVGSLEEVDGEVEVIHKRTKVINHDNNIDVILAGRVKNFSIDVPDEPKYNNQRMQKIVIESENDYLHLVGEVTGKVYDIRGRPELALVSAGYPSPEEIKLLSKPLSIVKMEYDGDDGSELEKKDVPINVSVLQLLYNSAKTYFVLSPKVEDKLLAHLKDYPMYEMIVKDAMIYFAEFEQSILDAKLQRLWRRFLREHIYPQLVDAERMQLMEDRLNFEIPYTDDAVVESDHGSSSEEEDVEKHKKKKGKRKKGVAKKKDGAEKPASREGAGMVGATPKGATLQTAPSASARVMQRMGTKKGIGLLAKRASVKGDVK